MEALRVKERLAEQDVEGIEMAHFGSWMNIERKWIISLQEHLVNK